MTLVTTPMARVALLLIVGAAIGLGQSSDTLDDLERRALGALASIPRAQSWNEVLGSREAIRTRLVDSLNLDQSVRVPSEPALLHWPKSGATPFPAVVLLRPHSDPAEASSKSLPARLAEMGIVVLELDARKHHSRLDLLGAGLLPQSLIQRDLRAAIAYLKARPDVDKTRLALVGEGLAATVGAAINPDFDTVALLDGAPDFTSMLARWRTVPSPEHLDACELLPSSFRYAGAEELLSLIAPRPLLLIQAENKASQYAAELYRWNAAPGTLQHRVEGEWSSSARSAIYLWLSRLTGRQDRVSESQELKDSPARFSFPPTAYDGVPPLPKEVISESTLLSALGDTLPKGPMVFGINCRGDQRVEFQPQAALKVPATALRPGHDACGASRGTLIAVDDRGRDALTDAPIVKEAIRRGWIVWAIDPRGIGESKTKADAFVFATSLALGENFAWRQSRDILGVLRHVGGIGSRDPTALYARGKIMSVAASYVAAVADRKELEWVVLEDAAVAFGDMKTDPIWAVPFHGFKRFDIADLVSAAHKPPLVIPSPEEFIQRDW